MSKIVPVVNGETGLSARNKINEAMAPAPTDGQQYALQGSDYFPTGYGYTTDADYLITGSEGASNITLVGSVAKTFTLPLATGLASDYQLGFKNEVDVSGQSLTIATQGGDTINGETSIVLNRGEQWLVVRESATTYIAIPKATTLPLKRVVVNSLSDFPIPVADVSTLEDNTLYLIGPKLQMGSVRLVCQANTFVKGISNLTSGLTYTGTGALFTMNNVTSSIEDLELDTPNGDVFDWDNTTAQVLRAVDCRVNSCQRIGTFNSTTGGIIRFTNFSPANVISDGCVFTGSWRSFYNEVTAATINGGSYYNVGNAVFGIFDIDTAIVSLATGAKLISGLLNSGNIIVNGTGKILNQSIAGAGASDPLSNITTSDNRWDFLGNNIIPDTRPDALVSIEGNVSETTVLAANTPVKANGVFTIGEESRFASDTTGRITYTGEKPFRGPIDFSTTVVLPSGGDRQVTCYIAINGSVVTTTGIQVTASSTRAGSATLVWQHTFQPNDYVEVWVENNSAATNIILQQSVGRVN